jgi:hypothetical protein
LKRPVLKDGQTGEVYGRLMQRTPWIVGSPRNPRHTAVARIECPRCGAHSILDAAALGVSTTPNILQVATRTGIVYGRVLKFSLAPGKGKSALPAFRSALRAPDIIRLGVSAPSCWPGQLARSRRGFWRISYGQEFQQNSVHYPLTPRLDTVLP